MFTTILCYNKRYSYISSFKALGIIYKLNDRRFCVIALFLY
jgi:hypothetical protein